MDIDRIEITPQFLNEIVQNIAQEIKHKGAEGYRPFVSILAHDINQVRHVRNIMIEEKPDMVLLLEEFGVMAAREYLLVDVSIIVCFGTSVFIDKITGEKSFKKGIVITAHTLCNKSSSAIIGIDVVPGVSIDFNDDDVFTPYDPNQYSDTTGIFRSLYLSNLTELRSVMALWSRRRKEMYDPCMN